MSKKCLVCKEGLLLRSREGWLVCAMCKNPCCDHCLGGPVLLLKDDTWACADCG